MPRSPSPHTHQGSPKGACVGLFSRDPSMPWTRGSLGSSRALVVWLTTTSLGIGWGFAPGMTDRSPGGWKAVEESAAEGADWPKAIIFDIDGTLSDSWKLGFDATQVVLEKNGIPAISKATYHECTRYATPDRLARHAGLEPGDEDYERVGKRLAKEFDDLYVGLVSLETAGFFEGIRDFLEEIPEAVVLGALTNACGDYAHAVLRVNAARPADYERFQSIKGADEVPLPKPAPDGLKVVCEDLSVDPSDCVYVGDSPSDALAAFAAGMPAVGVLWGSHSEESLRQAPFSKLCKTVDELRAALNRVAVQ